MAVCKSCGTNFDGEGEKCPNCAGGGQTVQEEPTQGGEQAGGDQPAQPAQ